MFKPQRSALGLSQSKLARLSGVPRLRICLAELGDVKLIPEEQDKIRAALQAESDRLRNLPVHVNFETASGASESAEEAPF